MHDGRHFSNRPQVSKTSVQVAYKDGYINSLREQLFPPQSASKSDTDEHDNEEYQNDGDYNEYQNGGDSQNSNEYQSYG